MREARIITRSMVRSSGRGFPYSLGGARVPSQQNGVEVLRKKLFGFGAGCDRFTTSPREMPVATAPSQPPTGRVRSIASLASRRKVRGCLRFCLGEGEGGNSMTIAADPVRSESPLPLSDLARSAAIARMCSVVLSLFSGVPPFVFKPLQFF